MKSPLCQPLSLHSPPAKSSICLWPRNLYEDGVLMWRHPAQDTAGPPHPHCLPLLCSVVHRWSRHYFQRYTSPLIWAWTNLAGSPSSPRTARLWVCPQWKKPKQDFQKSCELLVWWNLSLALLDSTVAKSWYWKSYWNAGDLCKKNKIGGLTFPDFKLTRKRQ